MTTRTYKRDRLGRFAATPGSKVSVASALNDAEAALHRAEQGVDQIAANRRAKATRDRRTVRRSALAGAVVGAALPAPTGVKVTATTATAFAAATTAAGAKIGQTVGRAKVRRSASGTRIRR